MHRRMLAIASILVTAGALTAVALPAVGATPADDGYTVQTLHFAVETGPNLDQPCDIIGDVYVPDSASPTQRVPAILTTNGFGGSKDDQEGLGIAFAQRGYVVLSYSGLGFGGSGCKITLDDPDYDGQAARQLVSYLGGAPGIAYTDAAHTTPAPVLDVVVHDATDHAGKARTYDPRVGMIGGSYGGEVQFAAASVDPRVDTIIPLITWNDLSYSLNPNNTAQAHGVTSATPGALKLTWGALFTAEGLLDGIQDGGQDPTRLYGCPNFADFVCTALATALPTGYFQKTDVASFRHASVVHYMHKITIPTLLVQGEFDTLFNLDEAAATYKSLRAQGTPVKMIWQSWGHSQSTPAPGELDLTTPDPATQYETARFLDWFDHYLKGSPVSTGPRFAYFRDWVDYTGIATPAYATASSYPLPRSRTEYLSGDGQLTQDPSKVTDDAQSFVTPAAGAPTSLDPLDVIGSFAPPTLGDDDTDAPGTFAAWTTKALARPLDVVGSPTLRLRVDAPSAALTQSEGPAGQLVLFVKLRDVAADGTSSLIRDQVAPIRVPDVTKPFTVHLPGIVHRFAPGHSLEVVLAGGSVNYRGGLVPTPVSVSGGTTQVLTLPTD